MCGVYNNVAPYITASSRALIIAVVGDSSAIKTASTALLSSTSFGAGTSSWGLNGTLNHGINSSYVSSEVLLYMSELACGIWTSSMDFFSGVYFLSLFATYCPVFMSDANSIEVVNWNFFLPRKELAAPVDYLWVPHKDHPVTKNMSQTQAVYNSNEQSYL